MSYPKLPAILLIFILGVSTALLAQNDLLPSQDVAFEVFDVQQDAETGKLGWTNFLSLEWNIHFARATEQDNTPLNAGLLTTVSYARVIRPKLSMGGGAGILTGITGPKAHLFPIYAEVNYEIFPRCSTSLNLGYAFAKAGPQYIKLDGGLFVNPQLTIEIQRGGGMYSSRVGIGYMVQHLSSISNQVLEERNTTTGLPARIQNTVYREGFLSRFMISYSHNFSW